MYTGIISCTSIMHLHRMCTDLLSVAPAHRLIPLFKSEMELFKTFNIVEVRSHLSDFDQFVYFEKCP